MYKKERNICEPLRLHCFHGRKEAASDLDETVATCVLPRVVILFCKPKMRGLWTKKLIISCHLVWSDIKSMKVRTLEVRILIEEDFTKDWALECDMAHAKTGLTVLNIVALRHSTLANLSKAKRATTPRRRQNNCMWRPKVSRVLYLWMAEIASLGRNCFRLR